ncbi:hypothetical protein MKEN_01381000 [Mycena kentingensis (nom. inval.)]|nr:hypothetical protein MKEN_01381000 [Mycena kentingensis (nom. inval.)]
MSAASNDEPNSLKEAIKPNMSASDTGRQSFTDKAASAMKFDSQKDTTEQWGDSVKGQVDSLASTLQPNSQKSMTQKAGDKLSSNQNYTEESLLDKAKNTVGLGDKH